jgi:predicted amidohydrolase
MTPSEPPSIRTTVAQLDPVLGDVQANRETIEATLSRARAHQSDLVVFPELFLTGYHIGDEPAQLTREATQALEAIREQTADIACVVGTPTLEDGEIYNSAVVLEDEAVKGTYHKTHLYADEHDIFTPGDRFPTIETSLGTLGVEICYDLEFPEVARALAVDGIDLLLTMSANMHPHAHDQQLYHGTRAIENSVPHVLCNRVGAERGVDFFGKSGIVDRRGQQVLGLGADVEETTSATIEMQPDRTHIHDYLEQRRPEIYDS